MISKSVRQTHAHATKLSKVIKKKPCLILLSGPLGVGKTEWARGFIRSYLGAKKLEVTSPSYSLINSYTYRSKTVHHVDLYRIQSLDDLESIGFWDLITDKNLILVEWPQTIKQSWPEDLNVIEVQLEFQKEAREILEINPSAKQG